MNEFLEIFGLEYNEYYEYPEDKLKDEKERLRIEEHALFQLYYEVL